MNWFEMCYNQFRNKTVIFDLANSTPTFWLILKCKMPKLHQCVTDVREETPIISCPLTTSFATKGCISRKENLTLRSIINTAHPLSVLFLALHSGAEILIRGSLLAGQLVRWLVRCLVGQQRFSKLKVQCSLVKTLTILTKLMTLSMLSMFTFCRFDA